MEKYTMTVIDRCGAGACRCCGQQFAERYTVELTSGGKSERAAVCTACAKKLYANAEKKAEPTKARPAQPQYTAAAGYADEPDAYEEDLPAGNTTRPAYALQRFTQKLTPLLVSIPYALVVLGQIIQLVETISQGFQNAFGLSLAWKVPLVCLWYMLPCAGYVFLIYAFFTEQPSFISTAAWVSFGISVASTIISSILFHSNLLNMVFIEIIFYIWWPLWLALLVSDRVRATVFGQFIFRFWFIVPALYTVFYIIGLFSGGRKALFALPDAIGDVLAAGFVARLVYEGGYTSADEQEEQDGFYV